MECALDKEVVGAGAPSQTSHRPVVVVGTAITRVIASNTAAVQLARCRVHSGLCVRIARCQCRRPH
eukprot:8368801-Pyramimonas_sp.AAC.1